MVRLNVFFVRCADSKHEGELVGEKLSDLPNLSSIMDPSAKKLNKLTKTIDPPPTQEGLMHVELGLRALTKTFTKIGTREIRRLALITEPFKRCVASACMAGNTGFEIQDWSEWGLIMPETLAAPSAIPIVVANGLIDAQPCIRQMGGSKVVLDGGLIHCAALFWNKAYRKDPVMGIVQEAKDIIQERVKKWCHGGSPEDYRFVADLQILKLEEMGNPYSLQPMSIKFNITTNPAKPNKILDPHRSGEYHSKVPPTPDSESMETLDEVVETARRTACNTIIMVVTKELIEELLQRIGKNGGDLEPGTILSMVAKTKKGGEISWKLHHVVEPGDFNEDHLPPFPGDLDVTLDPPEEFDEAMEGLEEKWGPYPQPPPKEYIPSRYPKIPPFSECLDGPEPTAKWAWVHIQGEAVGRRGSGRHVSDDDLD